VGMIRQPQNTDNRPTGKPNRIWMWLSVIAAIFVVGTVAGYFAYTHQTAPSATSLDIWVKAQDFAPIHPARSDYIPGTLLNLGHSRQITAMDAEDLLGDGKSEVTTAAVPDSTLDITLTSSAGFSAGVSERSSAPSNGASSSAGISLHAKLTLKHVSILGLSDSRAKDLVLANTRVSVALKTNPDNLWLIQEALQVGEMTVEFTDKASAQANASMANGWVHALLGPNLNLSADGVATSTDPIIIGTRLTKLTEIQTSLGGGNGTMQLQKYSPDEVEKYRESLPASATLASDFDIFGLVIGLGNYSTGSIRAGGQLPDAVKDVNLITDDIRKLVPLDKTDQAAEGSPSTVRGYSFVRDDAVKSWGDGELVAVAGK
jgi:hypothetical protein